MFNRARIKMIDLNNLSNLVKEYPINLTEQDIFNFLKIERRWPHRDIFNEPTVQIISNTFEVVDKDFYKGTGYLDFEKWKNYYDNGFTTILTNVLDLTEELRNLQNKLKYIIGNNVPSNFIFSKGNSDNVPHTMEHNQDYDIIIKQIYGTGYWSIDKKENIIQNGESLIINKRIYRKNFKINNLNLSLMLNLKKD